MKFKLGDKVRITELEPNPKYKGKVGRIIQTDRIKRGFSNNWDYICEFDDRMDYPFCPKEMKKLSTKGEQLLFEFMETI